MWWNCFFEAIAFHILSTHIKCDNRQTIRAFIAFEASFNIKLHHVNVHRHWLRQKIQNETVSIKWTSNINILADELIKILSSQRHKKFIKLIDLEDVLISCIVKENAKEELKKKLKDAEKTV